MTPNDVTFWHSVDVKPIVEYLATRGHHGSLPAGTTKDDFTESVLVAHFGEDEPDWNGQMIRSEVWFVKPLDKCFMFNRKGYLSENTFLEVWNKYPIEDFHEVKPVTRLVEVTEWEMVR